MKKMKRLAAFLLAMVMVLAMSMPAMAATIKVPEESEDDKNNAVETYTAYKIFDVTTVKDADGTVTGWAYTLDASSSWVDALTDTTQTWFKLEKSANGSVYNVSLKEGIDNNETTAKAAAAYLLTKKPNNVTGKTLVTGDNDVEDGYYLITSSLGSNLALATTDILVNITEKNTYPSLTKAADKETASIGDKVTFTITLTVPESVNKEIIVHDKMEDGFTIVSDSIVAKEKDSENTVTFKKVEDNNITDGCTFELSFAAEAAKGKTITITYGATLNAKAEISTNTNDNSAWLTYSNFKSTPQTVQVKTYKFDLVKTGVENAGAYSVLEGAKFKLYNVETGGSEIALVKDTDDGSYRPALTNETGVEIEAGAVTVKGLAAGTYYLEETEAPDGYNKLTARTKVEITNENLTNTSSQNNTYTKGENDTGVQVINETGTVLPSTGGMGTTIFYIVGGILVVGAGVLLVTRKRMDGQKK